MKYTKHTSQLMPSASIDFRWVQGLRKLLSEHIPNQYSKPNFQSPGLTYGRHHGPPSSSAREASVLLLCYPDDNGKWNLPLIVRSHAGDVHSGQISFPGGKLEPGELPAEAALREFHEELGVEVFDKHLIGQLNSTFIYASHFWVHVFVAVLKYQPNWKPDAREVSQVIDLPVAAVFEEKRFSSFLMKRKGLQFNAPSLQWQNHQIWGATRHILSEFANTLVNLG